MSRLVDLTQVPSVSWAWVDEHVYAAILGCTRAREKLYIWARESNMAISI